MQPLLPFTGSGRRGYIYFVSDGEYIKIGWTQRWPISKRTNQHQTGNGRPLWILGCLMGTQAVERRLHQRFANIRVHGEWFRNVPELTDFIRATHVMDFMDLAA